MPSSLSPVTRASVARAAVLAGALSLVLVAGCSGDDDPGTDADASASPSGSTTPAAADPSASTSPTAPPTTVKLPKALRAKARTGVTTWIDATGTALGDPEAITRGAGPAGIAGDARRQTINLAVEYARNDWHVEGKGKVVRQRVTGRTTKPATLTLEVCIDSSDVRIIDGSGAEVGLDQGTPKRTLNLVTLTRRAGAWVVSDVSFPDDPNC